MTFDITQYETWLPIVAGFLIPFVVAFPAKQTRPTMSSRCWQC